MFTAINLESEKQSIPPQNSFNAEFYKATSSKAQHDARPASEDNRPMT